MLLIGSQALVEQGFDIGRKPNDMDMICTYGSFNAFFKRNRNRIRHCVPLSGTKYHIVDSDGFNYEFEIAWPNTAAHALLIHLNALGEETVVSPLQVLLALKLSHRYLKNSPHFLKTMRDIWALRKAGVELDNWLLDWLPWRERETYVYSHPKLDVSKSDFFSGDGVEYVYDHDSIHEAVAIRSKPAYTFYMKDGSEVMTSREKFFSASEQIRLLGVYEESCVLALERSQIPYAILPENPVKPPSARYSFELALSKVCTSIASGWFREYAWENYDSVIDIYELFGENDYVERFYRNSELLRPFKEAAY